MCPQHFLNVLSSGTGFLSICFILIFIVMLNNSRQSQSVLTKESTSYEIKAYFQKVLELKQSSEEFPINLDDVWMLAYSEKGKATRALKKNFIENEDFITIAQNGNGGRFTETAYKLSISCLEYFIARKIRPVFDVYRQVFHKAVEKPLSQIDIIIQSAQMIKGQEQRICVVESKVKEIEADLLPEARYTRDVLKSADVLTTTQVAKELGMSAQTLNKILKRLRVQYKQGGQWLLYASYQNKGLTKTHTFTDEINGQARTWHSTVWTEKGRKFIHDILKNVSVEEMSYNFN